MSAATLVVFCRDGGGWSAIPARDVRNGALVSDPVILYPCSVFASSDRFEQKVRTYFYIEGPEGFLISSNAEKGGHKVR